MSVGVFQEPNGDWSYSRVSGGVCIAALVMGFFLAILNYRWDAALVIAGYLSGYAVLSYGANKWAATKDITS